MSTGTIIQLQKEQLETYCKKNRDYGNSFDKSLDCFGLVASAVRMSDKLNRFGTLLRVDSPEVKDESIEDTLMDLSLYALMTVAYLREQKKPLIHQEPNKR